MEIWYNNVNRGNQWNCLLTMMLYSYTKVNDKNQPAMKVDFGNVHSYGEFVGRQQELQKLETLLNDKKIRYITIRGFGGMGKTALAIQAVKNFKSGRVFVISLVGSPSTDSTVSAIAGSLNIDSRSKDSAKSSDDQVGK